MLTYAVVLLAVFRFNDADQAVTDFARHQIRKEASRSSSP